MHLDANSGQSRQSAKATRDICSYAIVGYDPEWSAGEYAIITIGEMYTIQIQAKNRRQPAG
jgi:hypothetical protein